MKRLLITVALAGAAGCAAHARVARTEAAPPRGAVHWFHGSTEEAFAAARAKDKPLFLFWSAVWCPPCNQLKSVVLKAPEVGALLDTMVPVYLDGDTPNAQAWADRLHVSLYPTMLVLSPSGQELMRIAGFVEVPEFITAVRSALATREDLKTVIDQALAGKATPDAWSLLAFTEWDETEGVTFATRLALFRAAPKSKEVVRAELAARLLDDVAEAPDQATPELHAAAPELLDAVFTSDASIYAARATIVSSSEEIVGWAYPDVNDPKHADLVDRWVTAAEWIRRQPSVSLSTKMLAASPRFELWLLDHPNAPLPFSMMASVRLAVAFAERGATGSYERHAVISDAAEMLSDAGDVAGARRLLEREAGICDTPWYYQGDLARLALKAGENDAALDWSAKARLSAKGDATRLQWTVNDLLTNTKVPGPDQAERVSRLLTLYFDLAFSLPDGFSGRNGLRARKVLNTLGPDAAPPVHKVMARYASRCFSRSNDAADPCRAAFGRSTP